MDPAIRINYCVRINYQGHNVSVVKRNKSRCGSREGQKREGRLFKKMLRSIPSRMGMKCLKISVLAPLYAGHMPGIAVFHLKKVTHQ